MHIRYSIVVCLVLIMALPAIANADSSGWYIAADVGRSHFGDVGAQSFQIVTLIGQDYVPGSSLPITSDDSDTAYRLTGGYQFDAYWGLEIGYVDFGSATITEDPAVLSACPPNSIPMGCRGPDGNGIVDAKIKTHGWVLAGTAAYPFNDQWSVFGRLGVISGNVELDVNSTPIFANPPSVSDSSSGHLNTTYGVGVNWSFANHWSAQLGWDRYLSLGNSSTTGKYTLELTSIGLVYRF